MAGPNQIRANLWSGFAGETDPSFSLNRLSCRLISTLTVTGPVNPRLQTIFTCSARTEWSR